ncbi:MAG: hypothetical protein KAU24_00255 [Candidatus Aenigmarchaeota archaeon]|nr:hypothetical protein [Candidatus Aenigmarchaeota archaeon]
MEELSPHEKSSGWNDLAPSCYDGSSIIRPVWMETLRRYHYSRDLKWLGL